MGPSGALPAPAFWQAQRRDLRKRGNSHQCLRLVEEQDSQAGSGDEETISRKFHDPEYHSKLEALHEEQAMRRL